MTPRRRDLGKIGLRVTVISPSPSPDEPLNPVIGAPVEQRWRIGLEPTTPKALAGLRDVVLGIECEATTV